MQAADFSPATALVFADLAQQQGDPDAAIAALEQSLLQYPGNVTLHGRLVQLYQRIGNAAMAAHHAAYSDDGGFASVMQVWGSASVGLAHDTNPTAAESSTEIRLFDATSNTFQNVLAREREPDTLTTVALDLSASYQLSDSALLAADLGFAGEKYFATDDLDTVSGNLTIGPWLTLDDADGTYLRTYGTIGAASLGGDAYYTTVGGGAELRFALDSEQQLSIGATVLRTDYNGEISPNFDTNTFDNTAMTLSVGVFGSGPLQSTYVLSAYGGLVDAAIDSESYLFAGLSGNANIPMGLLAEATGLPVTLHIGGSVDQFRYREADPLIDPTRLRQDFWLGADGAVILSVTDVVDVTFGAKYLRRLSNIAAFESDNLRIYTELGVNF